MTTATKQFKDFGIKPQLKAFTGEKIKMDKIINTEITVIECKLEPSKKNEGQCLHMQIEYKNEKRVVFTGATALIDVVSQLPADAYPFTTTIVKNNERFEFT